MALNPFLAKKLYSYSKDEFLFDSCMEFGNQRFMLSNKESYQLLKMLKREDYFNFFGDANENLYDKTRKFYEFLGIKCYKSIDLNGFDDALKFDLNEDILNHYNYKETYNLIINNGTSEHVFDQKNVFLNSHNLCREGGYMIHMLPFFSWVNHGFYNFNPILFFDLAIANNYQVIDFCIGNRNEELISSDNKTIRFDKTQEEKGLSRFFENISLVEDISKKRIIKNLIKSSYEKIKNVFSKSKVLSYEEFTENIDYPHKGKNFYRQILKSFLKSDNLGRSPFTDLSILVLLKKNGDEKFVSPYQGKYQSDYN